MSSTRSNSSQKLRDNLKKNYVHVPDADASVSFDRYHDLAKRLYWEAIDSSKNGKLIESYIQFHKFMILLLQRMPTHKDFHKNRAKYDSLRKNTEKIVIKKLEEIVAQLDLMEDKKKEIEAEFHLIDEFDCDPGTPKSTIQVNYPTSNGSNLTLNQRLQKLMGPDLPADLAPPLVKPEKPVNDPRLSTDFMDSCCCGIGPRHHSQECKEYENTGNPMLHIEAGEDGVIDPDLSMYTVPELQQTEPIIEQVTCGPEELSILGALIMYKEFYIPPPTTTITNLHLGAKTMQFYKDDFHVSFLGFLGSISTNLQMSKAALETNRCFFVHLGIATQLHPFVLQSVFRHYTSQYKQAELHVQDIVNSVNSYTGFVDANCLCFLWLEEFDQYQICYISGSDEKPIFSCFYPSSTSPASRSNLTEIIIKCDGQHFTLLRPVLPNGSSGPFRIFPALLSAAKEAGNLVLENQVQPTRGRSVDNALNRLLHQ